MHFYRLSLHFRDGKAIQTVLLLIVCGVVFEGRINNRQNQPRILANSTTMTSRCWMCLCRLAVYISLINIVIVSVMLLRNNNCAFTDCVNVPTAPRDDRRSSIHTNGGNITCYDSNVGTPAHGDDEEGMRRYNCPTPRFSDVPLASTALASSPGSGSTWLRHLLQKATGRLVEGNTKYFSAFLDVPFIKGWC